MRLLLAALLASTPALAQVSTDSGALDRLAPAPPPAQQQQPAKRKPIPTHRPKAAASAPRRLTTPSLPAAPPAHPVIQPPPFVMPAHAPPPPPVVPTRTDAAGSAQAVEGGTRITFGAGSSDLNPATEAALRAMGAKALADPTVVVSILAWAPGTSDDPSAARRLSLDRALAVRAVLIRAGLVSDRIRAVAKGALDPGGGALDRADVLFTK